MSFNWHINEQLEEALKKAPKTPYQVLEEVGMDIARKTNNAMYATVYQTRSFDFRGKQEGDVTASLYAHARLKGEDSSGGCLLKVVHPFDEPWPAFLTAWNPLDYQKPLIQHKVNSPIELEEVIAKLLSRDDIVHWLVGLLSGGKA